MKKDLVGIVAGIGLVVATMGISYVAYNVVKDNRAYIEKKEKLVLGLSGAGLVTLGYCLNKASNEEIKK